MTTALAIHVGRQPVYDRRGEVVGYELLFRAGADAAAATSRNAFATSQVIVAAFTDFGLDQLVGDRPCFVNLTREFLVGDLPVPFEPGRTVLEVPAAGAADDEVCAGVRDLADRGHPIALDHFEPDGPGARLLPVATYVKLDMLDNDTATLTATAGTLPESLTLVAERVETEERLELAFELGFDLFQGHVLGRAHVISGRGLTPSAMRRLDLMTALTAGQVELRKVVALVTTDPALSFRLLRATNSAASGLRQKVGSIRDAVTLLGLQRVREWVALMVVSDVCAATEDEIAAVLIRARLCQTVAEHLGLPPESGFTVGLLSGVADLLGQPAADLAHHLPLTPDVAAALIRRAGRLGEVLTTVHSYEQVDLGALGDAPVEPGELAQAYLSALGWSTGTLASLGDNRRIS